MTIQSVWAQPGVLGWDRHWPDATPPIASGTHYGFGPKLMADTLLTPSKITAWLDCSWYLAVQRGDGEAERNHPGPLAELLMDKGLAHEAACLAAFEAQG